MAGNTQLEHVIRYDPEIFQDIGTMLRYLSNAPIQPHSPENHIIGSGSFFNIISGHISQHGVLFLTYGGTSPEDAVEMQASNLAAVVESVYGRLNAPSSSTPAPKLNIATDLLPVSCQENLENYLSGKISEQDFFTLLTPEYNEKAGFASKVLVAAKAHKLEVIALDPGAEPDALVDSCNTSSKVAKAYRMSTLIPPNTLVIAYEDLVRNTGLLPPMVMYWNRAAGTRIMRITQNPGVGLSSAAAEMGLENILVNLTPLPENPADYLILGNVNKITHDDPEILREEAPDRSVSITTIIRNITAFLPGTYTQEQVEALLIKVYKKGKDAGITVGYQRFQRVFKDYIIPQISAAIQAVLPNAMLVYDRTSKRYTLKIDDPKK